MIHSFLGRMPVIHPTAFVAESADIIGDVEVGEDASIWFGAVLRGDVNYIRIGARTNIQDGSMLHVRHKINPLIIGEDVTCGHGAIIHGCTIASRCLVGMGAIVLDNARLAGYTLVAAGAVVRPDAEFPENVLLAGVPAKVVRDLKNDERLMIEHSAANYIEYVKMYRHSTMTG